MSESQRLFIKISGDRNTASICVEGDWMALTAIVTGTYLSLIGDPFRYIIRRMLNAEYLGIFGGLHIWHHRGRFFMEAIHTPAADWHGVVSTGNEMRRGDKTVSVEATLAEMQAVSKADWYLVKVSTDNYSQNIWQLCLAHFWL